MKTVLKALLAATALFPVAAYAQNANWQDRGEARTDRADNGPRGGQRGEWRARREPPNAQIDAQVRAQVPPPAIARGDRDDRPDRGDRRYSDDRRGFGDRERDRVDVQTRGEVRDYQRRADQDRRYDNGADAVRRYRDDRRQDARGYAPVYGQGYGQRYDDRRSGQWNRDWRRDGRYDWNRYRGINRSSYRLPRYYAPSGWGYGYRRFSVGVTLSSFLWDRNYWIDDPYSYRLPPAYGPYRWVRYYDDALLIDIRSGVVVDSVYGIFY